MPIYIYACPTCSHTLKKFLYKETLEQFQPACEACKVPLIRQFGNAHGIAHETTDDYRGKSRLQGIEQLRKERAKEYFTKVTLPKVVQDQGVEFCKRRGWIDADGNIKK